MTCTIISKRIASIISKGISKPLAELVDRFGAFAEGDIKTTFPTSTAEDEIAGLMNASHDMAERLQMIIMDVSNLCQEMSAGNFDVHSSCKEAYKGDLDDLHAAIREMNHNVSNALREVESVSDQVNTGATVFAATKEVIQANRFQNSDRLKELAAETEHTYLKTPAGIFTEVTLPVEEIAEMHMRDTLNAVSVTFTRYNEKTSSKYPMGIPQTLLMVRKRDMYHFFEKNETFDGLTSFVASYTSSGDEANKYSFPNIASLITACINEKKQGKHDEDWNKVVLIPVKAEMDSNNNIIDVKSNLDMESACLIGGEKDPIKIQVLYTTF